MARRWIDRADPHPSSTLVYQAADGEDRVLRLELPGGQPGSMVTLELFPDTFGAVVLNHQEAFALGKRLLRMAEKAGILGKDPTTEVPQ